MKPVLATLAALLLCLGAAMPAGAEENLNPAVSFKAGTLGVQGDLTVPFSKYVAGRVSLGYLAYTYSVNVDHVDYDFDINMPSAALLLDWHPAGGGFRVSGGVIMNPHDFSAKASTEPGRLYKIGDHYYPGSTLGNLEADADFNKAAPYLGIGYNGAFTQDGNWFFTFDLGVMYWGEADVDLKASNPFIDDVFREDIQKEENRIEDEIQPLQFWPVAAIGVAYRF